jgi:hypothetical protein
MSTTDDQYKRYLEKQLERLEAVEAELTAPPKPVVQTYRLKTNGAGSFMWNKGRWERL